MKRLRQLREERNLTLDEVAKALNLRNQYVSNYELGKRSPDYETLKKFARFYDVTVDYLLENDDKRKRTPSEEDAEFIEYCSKIPSLKKFAIELAKMPAEQRDAVINAFLAMRNPDTKTKE